MPIDPGVYFLHNFMSGTFLDISPGDDQGVVGSAYHGRESQQWELGKLGAGWFIRNVNNRHYLTIERGLSNSLPVGENEYPAAWVVTGDPTRGSNVFWIHWPKTRYSLNLAGGRPANGTKVEIYQRDEVYQQQLWRLIRIRDGDQIMPLIMAGCPGSYITTTTTTTTTTMVSKPAISPNGLENRQG